TRRLTGVVPANMQLDAPWKSIRAARDATKDSNADLSPSMMIAWCVVRAIEKNPAFRRIVARDGGIVEAATIYLGIAVALEGDRLATAAVHDAARMPWTEFAGAYLEAIAQ